MGNVTYNETTCGHDAYRRGAGQKIVGFSFYGDVNSTVSIEKGYFDGIVGNLKLMPKFYPGNLCSEPGVDSTKVKPWANGLFCILNRTSK